MQEISFEEVREELEKLGVGQAKIIREREDIQTFGDAEVVLAIDNVLVRLLRERGQINLQLAGTARPAEFFPFIDFAVFLGLVSFSEVEEAYAGTGDEEKFWSEFETKCAIQALANEFARISKVLSVHEVDATIVALRRAEKRRAALVRSLLKGLPKDGEEFAKEPLKQKFKEK